jgi:hypothetical protein
MAVFSEWPRPDERPARRSAARWVSADLQNKTPALPLGSSNEAAYASAPRLAMSVITRAAGHGSPIAVNHDNH